MSKQFVFSLFQPQPPNADPKKASLSEFTYHFDYGTTDCDLEKNETLFASTTDRFQLGLCGETALFCFDLAATLLIVLSALLIVLRFQLVMSPEWQIVMIAVLTLVTLRWYLAIDFQNPCLELLFACGLVSEGIGLFCLIHSYADAAR
ncbi:hypothetical protein L596_027214 [Steinernema carpocapsae]|uniref:Transmembrane protein n=1 Tax=Steinernema carpocapsae TaxID=34508 RepID=A0A4U5M3M7_STECR|nr:hypothetical protein L596_027214 [Steinernema carpocapsae]